MLLHTLDLMLNTHYLDRCAEVQQQMKNNIVLNNKFKTNLLWTLFISYLEGGIGEKQFAYTSH